MAGSAPLRIDDGVITLRAAIGGRAVSLVVDTGSETGLLMPEAVEVLSLPSDPAHRTRLQGTGGVRRIVANTVLSSIALDGLLLPVGSLPVETLPARCR